MIELQNVTKIYNPNRKKHTVALKDVSFALPDKGFVFVVGKSGCGKSTLLNMMGGCDRITSGEIVVDGNKFSQFGESDFDNFRNDYVGFIFQDYCLLDGLTVQQNVALALQLGGVDDEQQVQQALCKVEMEQYADRYPTELSGGQKQRIAIARTLVKQPKLILADEPTGNLDAKSSAIVLQLLKEMSQQMLVVIVSHNAQDAERYADRIIELSDGRILGDYSRNAAVQDIVFADDEIVIQRGTVFTDEQLQQINAARTAKDGAVCKIRQVDTRFLPTTSTIAQPEQRRLQNHNLTGSGKHLLFAMFAKKRIISMVFTSLIVVFIIAVMGVCQFFTQFSADEEIARIVAQSEEDKTFILQKGHKTSAINTTLITSPFTDVTDADIEAFRSTGYDGGIYPLYNISLMTHTRGSNLIWSIEGYSMPGDQDNYANFYCGSGLGVLVTNEQFLTNIYGKEDGKLKLLSGTLETAGPKIIFTDYLADSILSYEPTYRAGGSDPYATLTNGAMHLGHFRVAGVIDTGYKQRYADLIEKFTNGTFSVKNDADSYEKLLKELNSTLNIGYSFNPDFYQEYASDEECPRSVYYGTMEIRCGEHVVTNNSYSYRDDALAPDEILINRAVYAELMGISESETDESKAIGTKLTLSRYRFVRGENDLPDYTLEVTIAGFRENVNGVGGFDCSPEIYRQLKKFGNAPYALYFDNLSKAVELYDKGTELDYVVKNPLVSALYTVSRSALVFTDVFQFIGIVLLALAALMLAGFGAGSIRKNMYEIAVIRALGGKTKDLTRMFLLQMIFVSIVVCVLSVGAMAAGAGLCNSMLADGFVKLANNVFMRQLNVITFHWQTALIDAAAVLVLTAVAAIVPLLVMRRAKPREIIRAKE